MITPDIILDSGCKKPLWLIIYEKIHKGNGVMLTANCVVFSMDSCNAWTPTIALPL
jgi:hypothetical protein